MQKHEIIRQNYLKKVLVLFIFISCKILYNKNELHQFEFKDTITLKKKINFFKLI